MRPCFAIAAMLFASVSAHAQTPDPDLDALVRGNTAFALDLHKKVAIGEANAFFSPYSISTALAMTYAGARNNTAKEMRETLHFDLDSDKFHRAFARLIAETNGNDKKRPFQLAMANRLWGQRNYGFKAPFLAIARDHYRAPLEEVNYLDIEECEKARKDINNWVAKQTNDKIKDLLAPGTLDDKTRLVLTNAIYFKGSWLIPFDEKKTKKEPFHLLNGKTSEPLMMQSKAEIEYARNDDLSLVRLPYEGHDVSMIVLLPHGKMSLAAIEKSLSPANLNDWMKQMTTHSVDLKMPKFTMTTSFNLKNTLKSMGMKDAFDEIQADLKSLGISMGDFNLYISDVIHKAFIGIDEKSTEAAAATGVIVSARKSGRREPPAATFHVDHPFVFLIRDDRTGTILFMGRVANPG